MKKNQQGIKIKGLLLVGIMSIALTGCWNEKAGFLSLETEGEAERVLLSSAVDFVMPAVHERETERGSEVEIVPVSLTLSQQKMAFYAEVEIGSLKMRLPKGWEIEEQVSKEGITQYIVKDVHSDYADESEEIEGHKDGYEHEIVITAYEINNVPELSVQLAAAMRKYFEVPLLCGIEGTKKADEIKGCWLYGENGNTAEDEYFLFSQNGTGGMELFHVRDGDICITACDNDIEAFWEFMDKGFVWTDGGETVVDRQALYSSSMEYYYLFNAGTENEIFMVRDEPDEMKIYRGGSYQEPICSLVSKVSVRRIQIMDIDQDGYEDFLVDEHAGYLWKEESSSFVYVDEKQMLERFGFVFEERSKEAESQYSDGQIPDELNAYLSEVLLKNREEQREALAAMVSDRELTIDEVKELAEKNSSIKKEFLQIVSTYQGTGIWLIVDADNDGIEDIFLCEYLGGSLGSVSYYLFSGTEEGEYELTDVQEELEKEFGFINWEGKNYLVKTTWEFTKKCVDGLSVECYEEGTYQGGIWLAVTAKEDEKARSIRTSYLEDEKYQSLSDLLEEYAEQYEYGYDARCGTAEQEQTGDYRRSGDINNDGKVENYDVSLWQTTNYYTVDTLQFRAEDEEVFEQLSNMISEETVPGTPMNLWIDKTEFGNVTYIVYEEGLYDFHICGYFLSETGSKKLVQVDCYVETEVRVQDLIL